MRAVTSRSGAGKRGKSISLETDQGESRASADGRPGCRKVDCFFRLFVVQLFVEYGFFVRQWIEQFRVDITDFQR